MSSISSDSSATADAPVRKRPLTFFQEGIDISMDPSECCVPQSEGFDIQTTVTGSYVRPQTPPAMMRYITIERSGRVPLHRDFQFHTEPPNLCHQADECAFESHEPAHSLQFHTEPSLLLLKQDRPDRAASPEKVTVKSRHRQRSPSSVSDFKFKSKPSHSHHSVSLLQFHTEPMSLQHRPSGSFPCFRKKELDVVEANMNASKPLGGVSYTYPIRASSMQFHSEPTVSLHQHIIQGEQVCSSVSIRDAVGPPSTPIQRRFVKRNDNGTKISAGEETLKRTSKKARNSPECSAKTNVNLLKSQRKKVGHVSSILQALVGGMHRSYRVNLSQLRKETEDSSRYSFDVIEEKMQEMLEFVLVPSSKLSRDDSKVASSVYHTSVLGEFEDKSDSDEFEMRRRNLTSLMNRPCIAAIIPESANECMTACEIIVSGNEFWIPLLSTNNCFKRKGFGSTLVRMIQSVAEAVSGKVFLEVNRDWEPAMKLYKSCEFEELRWEDASKFVLRHSKHESEYCLMVWPKSSCSVT